MSNIYATEPPTSGKLILSTSHGDIEVELWSKETPKACRNVVGLALEGYYDDMLWHRIVPGFCIQTGDPTGTGAGGESFYGEPFQDEVNQRIKFNRRGLVAMANPGERDHNESQFFITLDSTPELQNKHTIFGRISGPTIYNVLSLSEVELSPTEPDRPVFPPKLHTIRVVDNPFPDIVPRITREEKRQQEAAKKRAREEAVKRQQLGDREKRKKNTGLLSFGPAEDEEEGDDARFGKGAKSSHDLLKNDKRLRKEAAAAAAAEASTGAAASSSSSANKPAASTSSAVEAAESQPKKRKKHHDDDPNSVGAAPIDLSRLRSDHASASPQSAAAAQISDLEASIRGLTKSSTKTPEEEKKKKISRGRELLEEAKRQYAAGGNASSGKRKAEEKEKETMELLRKFQAGASSQRGSNGRDLKGESSSSSGGQRQNGASIAQDDDDDNEALEAGMREYGASDDETSAAPGQDWRSHRFELNDKSKSTAAAAAAAEDNYITLDPRDTSSNAAAAMGFGSGDAQKRSREDRVRREGRLGRDWVDERQGRVGDGRGDGRDGRRRDDRRDGRGPRDGGRERERDRDRDRHRERDGREREALRPRDIERW